MADPFTPRPFNFRLMRHRVTVEEPSAPTPDGQGGTTPTWTTVGTFPARKRPLSGRELFNARQVKATVTHEITVRARVPITAVSRLTFEDTDEVFFVDVSTIDEWNIYRKVLATQQVGETRP